MTTKTIAQLFDLTGKGAIVTGGGMGIGQSIAFRLAEAGASVMIVDIKSETANQTVEQIKARGGKARSIQADASSVADARKAVQATVEAFGRLDILVNNAAIYPMASVMQISEEMWEKVLNTNLKSVFFYSQAAAQQMIKAGNGGKIINIASIDGIHPNRELAHYVTSKGGVVMLTKALALELAPHKILVNAIAPGGIKTPGVDAIKKQLSLLAGIDPEVLLQGFMQRVPLQREGEPDDIAKVVLFLSSAGSDYMTGSLVLVDGGYLLT